MVFFLKSYNPIILTSCALALASCATIWLDPINQVGPNTYQITHNMGKYSPTKGVRMQMVERATAKCTNMNTGYEKLREEMTPGGTLSYTLTFKCNSGLPVQNNLPKLNPTRY